MKYAVMSANRTRNDWIVYEPDAVLTQRFSRVAYCYDAAIAHRICDMMNGDCGQNYSPVEVLKLIKDRNAAHAELAKLKLRLVTPEREPVHGPVYEQVRRQIMDDVHELLRERLKDYKRINTGDVNS